MRQEVRIHQFYNVNKNLVDEMFNPFDENITVDSVIPIHSGMSTSNYCIISGHRKFLLKIYSGNTGSIEPVMYDYLKDYISVPTLLYYDDTKQLCPHSYAIIEYIEGVTLLELIRKRHYYPLDIVYKIGEMLSVIHQKNYVNSGLLDHKLNVVKSVKSTKELILDNINGKAGKHITNECKIKLSTYIEENVEVFNRIDKDIVLCHGDIGYGNILISENKLYFIDFEYALAESRYRDIGKFFRNKELDIQQYITPDTYNSFAQGYHLSGHTLPEDWLQLARIADIPVMLGLLNIDNPPKEWGLDIEHDILTAIT